MPSNPELLQQLQFSYTPRDPESKVSWNRVDASLGDRNVGHLQWSPAGTIKSVWTDPSYQRQGVATALHGHVKANYEPVLQHDDKRSPAGDKWARSVGGRRPR